MAKPPLLPPRRPHDPAHVPYAGPGLATPSDSRWAAGRVIGSAVWAAVWLGVVHLTLGVVVPKFSMIFADFKMDLPATTRLLLQVSQAYNETFGWLVLPFLVCTGVLAWLAAVEPGPRRRGMPAVVTLGLGLFVGWIVISLFSPMMSLIQGISSSSSAK